MNREVTQINTFSELMDEISYSFTDTPHRYIDHEDGTYSFNKLYITPTEVSYKVDLYTLKPEVYQKFLKFIELLKD